MTPAPNKPSAQSDEKRSNVRRFRLTLASVLTVQVITLLLLWLLQRTYTP
jgi:hypothetical protein